MSSLVLKPHLLSRCVRCIATVSNCRPQALRLASTVAKPAKAASKTAAASVPKKKISTKSTAAAAAPAKRPRKKSAPAVATGASETPTPAVKKTTRAASTKATASAKKADAGVGTEEAKTTATAAPRTRKTTSAASKSASAAPSASRSKPADTSSAAKPATVSRANTASDPLPEIEDAITEEVKGKVAPELIGANVDTSSPEYKQASRRYVSVMVALPILLVTSYFLFDRLALGHEPKKLGDFVAPAPAPEKKDEDSPA
ncbi:hypothetical protein BR93DRAFT_928789 [Coniochaeta sp. PMI_546]|nr:hypothetical protein BR93DRAFT_928789 [Coniochaeta sp. PMI_546]